MLRGYRAVRPLPADHERYLEVFHGLRLLQLTLWFLEQRDHPAFSDWETEVREGWRVWAARGPPGLVRLKARLGPTRTDKPAADAYVADLT